MHYLLSDSDLQIENFRYDTQISKINRRNIAQDRYFLITNSSIYNIRKQQVKRTINNRKVNAIIMSKTSNEFILKITNQYDYRFCSTERWKIYRQIFDISKEFNFQRPKLYLVEQSNLEEYTLTSKKSKCKVPNHLIEFFQQQFSIIRQQKCNLVICNLMQTDHRILYIASKDIFQLNPHDFKNVLQMGRFTYLIKNDIQHFIKKIIPKHLISSNSANIREKMSNYKQQLKKQKIHYIMENPDEFIVISECYQYSICQQLENFYEFTEEQIKKILVHVLSLLIQQELQEISIENILFNQTFDIIFTQFQSIKIKNYKKLLHATSPEQFEEDIKAFKNKKFIFWRLGLLLYKLIYGINLIPQDQAMREQFFENQIIRYDNVKKNAITKQLQNLLEQLLQFDPNKRFNKYINLQGNKEYVVVSILKHPWFLLS